MSDPAAEVNTENAPVTYSHETADGIDLLEEENKHLLGTGRQAKKEEKMRPVTKYLNILKILILFVLLVLTIIFFALSHEFDVDDTFAISDRSPLTFYLKDNEPKSMISLLVNSPQPKKHHSFDDIPPESHMQLKEQGDDQDKLLHIFVSFEAQQGNKSSNIAFVQIANATLWLQSPVGNVSQSAHTVFETPHTFRESKLRLVLNCSTVRPIPLDVTISQHSALFKAKIPLGLVVLVGVYVLIIFELVNRTVATIVGSFFAIGVMAIMNLRPPIHELVSWVDFNTLVLLFGMMIIVNIFAHTGFFEFVALKAYQLSRNNVWHLVLILCIVTAVSAAVLDNVTSMLLLTPVIVRLSKVVHMSPVPILISTVVISNIGGCATAVGDPPVVLIVNTPAIKAAGIGFNEILFYMAPGTVVICAASLVLIRLLYWKEFKSNPNKLSPEAAQKLREIEIWRTAHKRLSDASDEKNVKNMLENFIKNLENSIVINDDVDISELEKEYKITNVPLFISCVFVLSTVIVGFFVENFLREWIHLSLSWIALLGAIAILILSDIRDLDNILEKVEWSTLLFFASLFLMMGALERLGLIEVIGELIVSMIETVSEQHRLVLAITVIVWFSSIVSAFIDSIPYTTAMIPIVIAMSETLQLPLKPLVFSLAYGTGLGGNGTIIGATANLVVAGLSEKFGYPISFVQFFKIGFPVMILSTFIANLYLLFVHCLLGFGLK